MGLFNAGIGRRGIGGSVGFGPLRAGTGMSYREGGQGAIGIVQLVLFAIVGLVLLAYFAALAFFRSSGRGIWGLLYATVGVGILWVVLQWASQRWELNSAGEFFLFAGSLLFTWSGLWVLGCGIAAIRGQRVGSTSTPNIPAQEL